MIITWTYIKYLISDDNVKAVLKLGVNEQVMKENGFCS